MRFSASSPGFYTISVTNKQLVKADGSKNNNLKEEGPNNSMEDSYLGSLQKQLAEKTNLEKEMEQENLKKQVRQKEVQEELESLEQIEVPVMNKGEKMKFSNQLAEEREQYKQEKELAQWTVLGSKRLTFTQPIQGRIVPQANPNGPEYVVCHFQVACKLIKRNCIQLKLHDQTFGSFHDLIETYKIQALPGSQKCRLDQPAERY